MRRKSKVALFILDGWGIEAPWGGNAVAQASTPGMSRWWRSYPHTVLQASGEFVGLPKGTGGNSETGHLNIGAGRIVPQDLPYINSKIADKSFFSNLKIISAFDHVKKNNSNLHLVGLASLGHVHSDISHLYALLDMAKAHGVKNIYLDLFTDGRDSDPNSSLALFDQINKKLKQLSVGKISSICGRFFAMDRNKNWGRTSRAYNALTKGEAEISATTREAISKSYLRNIGDENIEPHIIADNPSEKVLISDNDAIIFFNFRPDRARQISKVFLPDKMEEIPDRKLLKNLLFITFVAHDPDPIGIVAFKPQTIVNPLAEVVSKSGLRQFHIAETEKYAHVTYFFNGGREQPYPHEQHFMVPSLRVKSYDMAPKMSARDITKKVISIARSSYYLIVCNYANADMVGHTGNFYATVQAVECVDNNLISAVEHLLNNNYIIVISADHGNAEEMINPRSNQPQTEHTSSSVPFLIISKQIEIAKLKLKNGGALANIAPTVLELMGLEQPKEMTAKSLIWRHNG